MSASIDLEYTDHAVESVDGVPVGVLTLTTLNPVDVPDDKWFVVERVSGSDYLVCVASVADFTNIPTTAPAASSPSQYWRTNSVTYKTDFPDDIPEVIANTRRRIQATIDAFKVLATIPAATVETFS